MRSRVSAAVARWPLKATRLANQMSEMTQRRADRWGGLAAPERAGQQDLDFIGRAVEFRGGAGVCDGEGPCHGCRQPWVALPAVMQMCGEAFEPLQRWALTTRPVAGGVESTELARQRCYQQVGFRREIAVKRADGDADPLGNRPHLNRLVTTGRGHGQSCIQNCFAAPCGGA